LGDGRWPEAERIVSLISGDLALPLPEPHLVADDHPCASVLGEDLVVVDWSDV
jgi:hypothetical protein